MKQALPKYLQEIPIILVETNRFKNPIFLLNRYNHGCSFKKTQYNWMLWH